MCVSIFPYPIQSGQSTVITVSSAEMLSPCCHRGNQDPLFPPRPPEAAGTFYLVVLQIFMSVKIFYLFYVKHLSLKHVIENF